LTLSKTKQNVLHYNEIYSVFQQSLPFKERAKLYILQQIVVVKNSECDRHCYTDNKLNKLIILAHSEKLTFAYY